MINNILDLSKIEADQYQLENYQLKVSETVSIALRMVSPQVEAKRLTVTTDIPDDLPDVWYDQQVILQILLNLIGNAVKYTENNGSITARARCLDDKVISLSISDTGIGMTAGEIVNVIEPFYRVDGHQARKQEGTGLGLHVCSKMVALIGATMDIKSGPGGTTVTVVLPRERSVERVVA